MLTDSLDIAVIGMDCRFPGAANFTSFWDNLLTGRDSITHFSKEEMKHFPIGSEILSQPNFVSASPVLEYDDCFDSAFFGYSPREADLMDPQHRIFLESSWRAAEAAGYDPQQLPQLTGVYAGTSLSSYLLYNVIPHLNNPHSEESLQAMIGNDKDFLSTRVSYKLNIKGPSLDVQTGCSTSLVAIHLAVQSLLSYQCDMALAGGVSIQVPQRRGYLYLKGGISSADGRCRAFDERSEGTVFGSGVGVVVLKRLSEALADRDHVYAVIRGSAINNDGNDKVGYTAPSINGQADVVKQAHEIAGVKPWDIGFVECHGTGTPLGDPAEIRALVKAFGNCSGKTQFCAIGSVKTNIGHLDAAAGVAGFIKAVLAVNEGMIPPNAGFTAPNPLLNLESSPFYVPEHLGPWGLTGTRRAGVSSFGIGGTNAHIVLEEPSTSIQSVPSRPRPHLLTLSAKTTRALGRMSEEWAQFLEMNVDTRFEDIAFTSRSSRSQLQSRLAVVGYDASEAASLLRKREIGSTFIVNAAANRDSKVIFLFPGGGSQYLRMGADLYESDILFRGNLDRLLKYAQETEQSDLRSVLFPDVEHAAAATREIKEPQIGLPLLFLIEYALATYWISWGVVPAGCIGHSLGEYTAACISGMLRFEDALHLVSARSRLLNSLPSGMMLSVPLPSEDIKQRLGERMSIAAINGPSQTVVSGPALEIEALASELEDEEVETRVIQIATSSHSKMVEPVLDTFRERLKHLEMNAPSIPCMSNVTGTWFTKDQAKPEYWVEHLRQPVLFGESIAQLVEDSSVILLEAGPGTVLSSLIKSQFQHVLKARVISSLRHPYEQTTDLFTITSALAQLWASGVDVDFSRDPHAKAAHRVFAPPYPFERRRHWIAPPNNIQAKIHNGPLPLEGRLHRIVWEQRLPNRTAAPIGPVFIVGRDAPYVESIVTELRINLTNAVRIRYDKSPHTGAGEVTIRSGMSDDVSAFFQSLGPADGSQPLIIFFPDTAVDVIASDMTPLFQLVEFVKGLGRVSDRAFRLVIAVEGVAQLDDIERIHPEAAALLGPALVAGQEYGNLKIHMVDFSADRLDRSAALNTFLQAASWQVDDSVALPLVAVRGSRISMPQMAALRLPERSADKATNRTYVITGGLGDIGLKLAEHLCDAENADVILLSRSGLPEHSSWKRISQSSAEPAKRRELIDRLSAIEERGGRISVRQADVTDEDRMRDILFSVSEEFDGITGIFHLAGTTGASAFELMSESSSNTIANILNAKISGARTLERLCTELVPEFIILFSSSASYLGGVGLMAYATANLFLDAFAEGKSSHEAKTRWVSLDWDAWIDERAVDRSTLPPDIGLTAISFVEGLEIVSRVVNSSMRGRLIVSRLDPRTRRDTCRFASEKDTERNRQLEDDYFVTEKQTVGPSNEMERKLSVVWCDLLGLAAVSITDNFFDLGGTSLIALRFLSRAKRDLGIDLPIVTLFERPTISQLSQHILTQV
jgi:Polyketide synthase modules and related proteins